MSTRPRRTARTAAAVASAANEELLTKTNNKTSNTGDASTKTTKNKNKNKKAIAVSDTSEVPESTTTESAEVASTSKPKVPRKKIVKTIDELAPVPETMPISTKKRGAKKTNGIKLDESAPKEQVDETPVEVKKTKRIKAPVQTKAASTKSTSTRPTRSNSRKAYEEVPIEAIEAEEEFATKPKSNSRRTKALVSTNVEPSEEDVPSSSATKKATSTRTNNKKVKFTEETDVKEISVYKENIQVKSKSITKKTNDMEPKPTRSRSKKQTVEMEQIEPTNQQPSPDEEVPMVEVPKRNNRKRAINAIESEQTKSTATKTKRNANKVVEVATVNIDSEPDKKLIRKGRSAKKIDNDTDKQSQPATSSESSNVPSKSTRTKREPRTKKIVENVDKDEQKETEIVKVFSGTIIIPKSPHIEPIESVQQPASNTGLKNDDENLKVATESHKKESNRKQIKAPAKKKVVSSKAKKKDDDNMQKQLQVDDPTVLNTAMDIDGVKSSKPELEVGKTIGELIQNGTNDNDESDVSLKRKLMEDEIVQTKRARFEFISGNLYTLGDEIVGELGPRMKEYKGKKVKALEPSQVKLATKVKQVACGAYHTIVITEDGKVISFGCNDDASLGRITAHPEMKSNDEDENEDDDDYEEKMCSKPLPVEGEIHSKVIKISAGDIHAAALDEDGNVFIWGNLKDESNKIGLFSDDQKNHSDYLPTSLPRKIDLNGKKVVDIASGNHHFIMLTDDNQVYSMGEGSKGQLGRIEVADLNSIASNRDLFIKPAPVKFSETVNIDRIFASQWCSYALTDDGKLYAWGLNNYYQLGFKTEKAVEFDHDNSLNGMNSLLIELFPTRVPIVDSTSKIIAVSCGQQHVVLLNENGQVYSCGNALYGRLGHGKEFVDNCGDGACLDTFKKIDQSNFANDRVKFIECGDFSSFAITETGKLYSWGQASSHIGARELEDRYEPTLIAGLFANDVQFFSGSSSAQYGGWIGDLK
ncbi:Regulator of chromosome condensation [Blomia tropicalis]|nr:Regulator of chromosome condensation [Blomia tropicalis]